MSTRVNIKELEPEAYKAMYQLENYLSKSTLDRSLKELIKIRSSQINGCAYCIDMHTEDAIKNGESTRRIFAISAWWESPLFTDKEKALLAITDEVTQISSNGLSEETYEVAEEFFTENEIAQIIMQIGTINIWNRIAVSTHLKYEK